jgi:hypothetical protein
MSEKTRPLVCQQCAQEKTNWIEHCSHVIEVWKNGYKLALREYRRPRLTSEHVRRAASGLSFSWENFYHLPADALNRILDEKEKTP